MRVIGLMSGTSHDGIDSAAVDFAIDGDTLRAQLLARASTPYPAALRQRLLDALPPGSVSLEEVCRLDAEIGQAFAAAAQATLEQLPDRHADLVCSHGQTVFHGVGDDGRVWGTLQLGQPAWIAERAGLPVVSDLRTRDVAAGGQGAPLVGVVDELLLGGLDETVAALNLGGIANVTVLVSGQTVAAYDIGPANALIDAAVAANTDGRELYDADGRAAARGRVDAALLQALLADPYYDTPLPKTTGKERFNGAYLAARCGDVTGDDLVATVTALTAEVVARDLLACGVERVLVSGGGVRNPTLMGMLAERLPGVRLGSSDELGAPPDDKEAIAFALLGWLTAHGLPGSLARCTGAAGERVLGSITPGREPLRLPDAVERMPRRLVIERAEGNV
jgi:anhydro-N-acetylmuramic acid kinase